MAVLPMRTGGEGGIRTPGTLIRGTHDFQSCTFNRSVTSPERNFKHLRALPRFLSVPMSPKCLHGACRSNFERSTIIIRGKDELSNQENKGCVTRLRLVYSAKSFTLWRTCAGMSP